MKYVLYFKSFGFECPKQSNPSDDFVIIMNEEGLIIEKL